jgi:hypothetical protein
MSPQAFTDRDVAHMKARLARLQDERDVAIGDAEEAREKLLAAHEDIELLSQRVQAEKNRYGEAIRLMHHGLRWTVQGATTDDEAFSAESIRQLLALNPATVQALVTLSIGIGYAYALEVMTRRAAPDHLRSGLEWWLKANGVDPAEAMGKMSDLPIYSLYETSMRAFPQPPHAAYEEGHGGDSD